MRSALCARSTKCAGKNDRKIEMLKRPARASRPPLLSSMTATTCDINYPTWALGPGTDVIDANTQMWQFFSRFRLDQ
jgi:hypothetical protein